MQSLYSLISVYFALNIAYPKPLHALFVYLQHHVLLIKDSQHVPVSVTQLLSSLDKI